MKKPKSLAALFAIAVLSASALGLAGCKKPVDPTVEEETVISSVTNAKEYFVGDKVEKADFTVKVKTGVKTSQLTAEEFEVTVPAENLTAEGTLKRTAGSEGESEKISVQVVYKSLTKSCKISLNDAEPVVDLETAYKSYLVGGTADERALSSFQNWGSGTSYVTTFNDPEAEDFPVAVEMTSGNSWDFNAIYLSYGDLIKNYINRYTHAILTVNKKDFTFDEKEDVSLMLSGEAGKGDNRLIVTKYGKQNSDDTVTYVVPLKRFSKEGLSSVAGSNQLSMILRGSGKAIVTEFYLAVQEKGEVDLTAASSAIKEAETAVADYVIGTEPDCYPQQAKDDFDAVVASAKLIVADANSTQAEVDAVVAVIANAKEALDGTKILDTASIPSSLNAVNPEHDIKAVLYSAADGVENISTWNQNWGGSCTPENYEVEGKNVKFLKNSSAWFGLTDFTTAADVVAPTASAHTILHFDVFTNTNISYKPVLVEAEGAKHDAIILATSDIEDYGWHSVDVDLSTLYGVAASMIQFGWGTSGNFYIDNIYLYEEVPAGLTVTAETEIEIGGKVTLKAVDASGNDVTASTTFTVEAGDSTIEGAVLTAAAAPETVTVKAVNGTNEAAITITVTPMNPAKYFTTKDTLLHGGDCALANKGYVTLWSDGQISKAEVNEDATSYTVVVASQTGNWYSVQIFYAPKEKSNLSFKYKVNKDCTIFVNGVVTTMTANVEQEFSIQGLPVGAMPSIQLGADGQGNAGPCTFTITDFTVTPIAE